MVMRPPRVSVGGVDIDPCDIPVPLTITYGSSDIRNQPDAPSCSFQIEGEPYTADRALGIGQLVVVSVEDDDGTTRTRFIGRVTDLTTDRSQGYVATAVTALGRTADLAGLRVEAAAGTQPASARFDYLRNRLPVAYRPWLYADTTSHAWTVEVGPEPAGARSPVETLQELAVSVRGRVAEDPAGEIWMVVGTRGEPFEVPCRAVVDARQWSSGVGDVVNHVTVRGLHSTDNVNYEQTERTVERQQSIDQHGYHHQDIGTILVDDGGVGNSPLAEYARQVLDDWAQPRWEVPQVVVDAASLRESDHATWVRLIALKPWDVVRVVATTGIPIADPQPDTDFIVVGWTETWTATDDGKIQQDMQLALARDFAGRRDGVLLNLGPVGTPTRNEEWSIRVRLIDASTGNPVAGIVRVTVVGPNTQGPEAHTDPATGIADVIVPAVDAENVSILVESNLPGAEFSARYPLYNPQALWTDPDATWHDQDWSWTGIGV
jgi:hypothetical protein